MNNPDSQPPFVYVLIGLILLTVAFVALWKGCSKEKSVKPDYSATEDKKDEKVFTAKEVEKTKGLDSSVATISITHKVYYYDVVYECDVTYLGNVTYKGKVTRKEK